MGLLPPSISSAGRLAPRPFAIGAVLVFVVGLASQALLEGPTVTRLGVWPFVLVQAVLIWSWTVLHVRRLRDAGRGSGAPIVIAIAYAIGVAAVASCVWLFVGIAQDNVKPEAGPVVSVLAVFFLIAFISLFSGTPDLGLLPFLLIGSLVVMVMPTLIGIGFSIWAGTRPSRSTVP